MTWICNWVITWILYKIAFSLYTQEFSFNFYVGIGTAEYCGAYLLH